MAAVPVKKAPGWRDPFRGSRGHKPALISHTTQHTLSRSHVNAVGQERDRVAVREEERNADHIDARAFCCATPPWSV